MSNRANSARIDSEMPTSAALLAEYSVHDGNAHRPHRLATFRIAGLLPSLRSGNADRTSSTGAKKLVSMIDRKVASSPALTWFQVPMPALFTRPSRPPMACSACPTSRSRNSGLVMSPDR